MPVGNSLGNSPVRHSLYDGTGFARRNAARRARGRARAVRAAIVAPIAVAVAVAVWIAVASRVARWHSSRESARIEALHTTAAVTPEETTLNAHSATSAEDDGKSWLERVMVTPVVAPENTTDFTMFRGNPERSLSGVGTIPKHPKLLWRFRTKTKLEGEFEKRGTDKVTPESPWPGLGWTGQPVRLGDRIYFGSSDSNVYCIDLGRLGADAGFDGSNLESLEVSTDSSAPDFDPRLAWYYPTHHCVKGSIAIFDGLIYHGGRDNKIHCYDLEGRMVWETRTGNDMDSSPVVVDELGYIGGEDHNIYCFDPKSGEIVWKYEADAGSFESSPCIAGDAVVLGTSQGWLFSVDRKTGKLNWKVSTQGDTDSTPVYVDGRIYVGCATGDENETGHYWCIDAATGKTIWHKTFKRGIWATAAVNAKAGTIYIGCANGFFYCLRMKDGEAVWKRNLGSRIWSSAVVSEGRLLVSVRDGRMWCLEEGTGKPVWVFDCGGDIDATPLVAGGLIVIGNQDGWVYCIGEAGSDASGGAGGENGIYGKSEPINKNWFITEFPAKMNTPKGVLAYPSLRRTPCTVSKDTTSPNYILTIHNPAPAPKTYTDTNAGTRTNYLKPVYGEGWKDVKERMEN